MRGLTGIFAAVVLTVSAAAADPTFQSVGLYQTAAQLATWANNFAAANPDLVSLHQYGLSYEGRPLQAIQISLTPGVNDPAKGEYLFTANIHAREVVTSQADWALAEHLVSGYRSGDAACVAALASREVWILPDLNPDGRVWVENGYSRQRKNTQLYPGQTPNDWSCGVDLNRNFPHLWYAASSNYLAETYRGPRVLSAPEASSLWSMLHDKKYFSNLLGAIDYHSGYQNILSPWTSPSEADEDPLPPDDRARLDALADRMGQITGFSTDRLPYDSYGTLTDSLYEAFGTNAFTIEMYTNLSAPDYMSMFNPITQDVLQNRVGLAVDAGMYLLSDEAAAIIPEPTTIACLLAGGLLVVARRRKNRD